MAHKNGRIELRDRSKDIIISGGENISSIEVENTLHNHHSVLEAAVRGSYGVCIIHVKHRAGLNMSVLDGDGGGVL